GDKPGTPPGWRQFIFMESHRERAGLDLPQEFLFDRPPRVGGLEFPRTPGRGAGPSIQSFLHTSSITQPLRAPASVFSYGPDRNCLWQRVLPLTERRYRDFAECRQADGGRCPQRGPQDRGVERGFAPVGRRFVATFH